MEAPQLAAVGMDVGGTSTRVLVVDARGRRIGSSRAGGGNPTARRQSWAQAMSTALREALSGMPVEVRSVAVGVAGVTALLAEDAGAGFEQLIRAEAGESCEVQVTSDLEVAFAAGTHEPDGTVLVAGTGSAAGAIRDRALVQMADGHGWLLGDAGSGFWIGREAAQSAMAGLDGRRPATALLPMVIETLLGRDWVGADPRTTCLEISRAVYARPPVELAMLAPLVSRCAAVQDPVASRIARRAVSYLVAAVEAVRSPGDATPVVVTGGIGAADHAIAVLLHRELESRWPRCVRTVADGVSGAAWLALRAMPCIDDQQAARLHPLRRAEPERSP